MVRKGTRGTSALRSPAPSAQQPVTASKGVQSSGDDASSVAVALLVAYVAAAGCMCRYVASTGGSVTFALSYFLWFTLSVVVTVHRLQLPLLHGGEGGEDKRPLGLCSWRFFVAMACSLAVQAHALHPLAAAHLWVCRAHLLYSLVHTAGRGGRGQSWSLWKCLPYIAVEVEASMTGIPSAIGTIHMCLSNIIPLVALQLALAAFCLALLARAADPPSTQSRWRAVSVVVAWTAVAALPMGASDMTWEAASTQAAHALNNLGQDLKARTWQGSAVEAGVLPAWGAPASAGGSFLLPGASAGKPKAPPPPSQPPRRGSDILLRQADALAKGAGGSRGPGAQELDTGVELAAAIERLKAAMPPVNAHANSKSVLEAAMTAAKMAVATTREKHKANSALPRTLTGAVPEPTQQPDKCSDADEWVSSLELLEKVFKDTRRGVKGEHALSTLSPTLEAALVEAMRTPARASHPLGAFAPPQSLPFSGPVATRMMGGLAGRGVDTPVARAQEPTATEEAPPAPAQEEAVESSGDNVIHSTGAPPVKDGLGQVVQGVADSNLLRAALLFIAMGAAAYVAVVVNPGLGKRVMAAVVPAPAPPTPAPVHELPTTTVEPKAAPAPEPAPAPAPAPVLPPAVGATAPPAVATDASPATGGGKKKRRRRGGNKRSGRTRAASGGSDVSAGSAGGPGALEAGDGAANDAWHSATGGRHKVHEPEVDSAPPSPDSPPPAPVVDTPSPEPASEAPPATDAPDPAPQPASPSRSVMTWEEVQASRRAAAAAEAAAEAEAAAVAAAAAAEAAAEEEAAARRKELLVGYAADEGAVGNLKRWLVVHSGAGESAASEALALLNAGARPSSALVGSGLLSEEDVPEEAPPAYAESPGTPEQAPPAPASSTGTPDSQAASEGSGEEEAPFDPATVRLSVPSPGELGGGAGLMESDGSVLGGVGEPTPPGLLPLPPFTGGLEGAPVLGGGLGGLGISWPPSGGQLGAFPQGGMGGAGGPSGLGNLGFGGVGAFGGLLDMDGAFSPMASSLALGLPPAPAPTPAGGMPALGLGGEEEEEAPFGVLDG